MAIATNAPISSEQTSPPNPSYSLFLHTSDTWLKSHRVHEWLFRHLRVVWSPTVQTCPQVSRIRRASPHAISTAATQTLPQALYPESQH